MSYVLLENEAPRMFPANHSILSLRKTQKYPEKDTRLQSWHIKECTIYSSSIVQNLNRFPERDLNAEIKTLFASRVHVSERQQKLKETETEKKHTFFSSVFLHQPVSIYRPHSCSELQHKYFISQTNPARRVTSLRVKIHYARTVMNLTSFCKLPCTIARLLKLPQLEC